MEPAQLPVKRSRQEATTRPLANSWAAANHSSGPLSPHSVDKGIVSRWLRDDLEDRYLSLYQDHGKLKERFRQQEEKIKEFKMVLKKKQDQIRQQQATSGSGAAELRATDQVVKLEMRNVELEKQCAKLQQRLTLLQSQLESPAPRRVAANTRVLQPAGSGLRQQRSLGHQQDPRGDRARMQAANAQLLAEIEGLKDKMYAQEMEHQRRVQDLHSELETARMQVGNDKRATMHDDLEKVKLQRELREKAAMVEHLQARCESLEDHERQATEANSRLSVEMERLTKEMRRRDQETESLKESSTAGQVSRRRILELEHALEDANKEAKLLKDANDKLMGSAFNVERERQWQSRENALLAQIKELEGTMHRDVGEKGDFLDRLEAERSRGEDVEKELSVLRIKCSELQEQNDSLRQKLGFFTQESAGDMQEMEEALLVVKQRKQHGQQKSQLDFLHSVEGTETSAQDSHRRLREIEASHADTIQELDKTRQLLEAQYRINQDLKASHGLTERQLEGVRADRDAKMAESAKLLDIRAARIRKLERQLRDVAYGTRQFALAPVEGDAEDSEAAQVRLQNGENLVEFHVGRVTLTDEGARVLGPDPSLFCTWAFYVCELQTSDVVRGDAPDFDKTVQYVVKVDDAFLHYVNKEKMKLELFQAHGMEYHSQAACRISLRELLESQPSAAAHGKATLLTETGDALGVVEFWLRMRVPMEQAMRLYRERAKALGYMVANQQAAAEGLRALDESAELRRPAGGTHLLDVKLVRCRDLRARRPDLQPSPYCSYKFFDCEDALSPAIPNSCSPEFHFHQRLQLTPGPELDKHLRTQQLVVWVLDEADTDESTYLGVAKVDLVSLSQNKPLQGTYQLLGPDNQPSGTIDLELNWQIPYVPSDSWGNQSESLPLMPGEAEQLGRPVASEASRVTVCARGDAGLDRNAEAAPGQTHMEMQQQQQQQRPGSRTSSRAGSVVEDSCVERIQGVDEQTYKQHQQQQKAKKLSSARVARDMSKVLTAPPDRALPQESSDTADAESVSSLVPEPVKVEKRKPSLTDAEQKLRDIESSQLENNQTRARPGDSTAQESLLMQEKLRQEEKYEEEKFESEQESEGVVVDSGREESTLDSCSVQVLQVHLDEQSQVLRNSDLDNTRCYVSFIMPGYPIEETETPLALPTPRPGKSRSRDFDMTFNFQKIFDYSFQNNYEKRLELAKLLLSDSIELQVTLVCESEQEDSDFFADLGRATVPMGSLVINGQEIKEANFPLVSEGQNIGSIKLSTNLPRLLNEVFHEMPDSKKAKVKLAN